MAEVRDQALKWRPTLAHRHAQTRRLDGQLRMHLGRRECNLQRKRARETPCDQPAGKVREKIEAGQANLHQLIFGKTRRRKD